MSEQIVNFSNVEDKIILLHNTQAILDSEVAKLYGVETKRVNEAIKNNPEKFPDGYIISLSPEEWSNLKSKFSTSSWGGARKPPNAFTEKGLYMLATILKSESATQTTLAIVEAFAKIREFSRIITTLADTPDESTQKLLLQRSGNIVSDLLEGELKTRDTETSIELNLAVLKFKHTVRKAK